ncbi:hypothetical protein I3843_08G077200 [Carya illinoinensis]|nr:hypothetical protein I3843_08G077200 [Carya illinoinensis]
MEPTMLYILGWFLVGGIQYGLLENYKNLWFMGNKDFNPCDCGASSIKGNGASCQRLFRVFSCDGVLQ